MNKFNISIGSDHCGVIVKKQLIKLLDNNININVINRGANNYKKKFDYPDYAEKVCCDVINSISKFGILICHSGIGMTIASNKIYGIRSALIYNYDTAKLSKLHNNANIICFGSKYYNSNIINKFILIYMQTKYEKQRHNIRLKKIDFLNQKYYKK